MACFAHCPLFSIYQCHTVLSLTFTQRHSVEITCNKQKPHILLNNHLDTWNQYSVQWVFLLWQTQCTFRWRPLCHNQYTSLATENKSTWSWMMFLMYNLAMLYVQACIWHQGWFTTKCKSSSCIFKHMFNVFKVKHSLSKYISDVCLQGWFNTLFNRMYLMGETFRLAWFTLRVSIDMDILSLTTLHASCMGTCLIQTSIEF